MASIATDEPPRDSYFRDTALQTGTFPTATFTLTEPVALGDGVTSATLTGDLTIRGEKRSASAENTEGRYHIVERSYGTFTRSFQLPTGVDEKAIAAEFSDGLLVAVKR